MAVKNPELQISDLIHVLVVAGVLFPLVERGVGEEVRCGKFRGSEDWSFWRFDHCAFDDSRKVRSF
jgi:hypothetical protein